MSTKSVGLRAISRWVLAVAMVAVGVLHFVNPQPFLDIMPPWIPWHLAMVYISGFFEIAGGVGLLIPQTRRAAAWGLIALYIAVFPANIHMAVNDVPMNGEHLPAVALWGRLPLQFLLIYWAWTFTRREPTDPDQP